MTSLKRLETLILIVPLALVALFYLLFVCGHPLRWPYYVPVLEGATIEDPAPFLLPRANLSPIAVYPLADGVKLRMRVGCNPSNFAGEQECHFSFSFVNPYNASISIPEQAISVQSPSGEELIDLAFLTEYADRFGNPKYNWPKIVGEKVFIETPEGNSKLYGGDTLSLAKRKLPQSFRVDLPDVHINRQVIAMPDVEFFRRGNLTCVGLIANY